MTQQQEWILKHKLTENQRRFVMPRYQSREKNKIIAYLLWFFFGLYYFYLGKPVRNILLWIACGFLIGFLWWLVDLFRVGNMVDEYNDQLLTDLIKDSKVVMGGEMPDYEPKG